MRPRTSAIDYWVCYQANLINTLQGCHDADALLFLSEKDFGFPLIEAMYLGLPIVCPDLPFARALWNDAIYFDPNDISHKAGYYTF